MPLSLKISLFKPLRVSTFECRHIDLDLFVECLMFRPKAFCIVQKKKKKKNEILFKLKKFLILKKKKKKKKKKN